MCAQVMAVLLDHFVSATAREKHKELIQEEANRLLRRGVSTFEIQNPLGPLLEDLCRFTDQVWLSKQAWCQFIHQHRYAQDLQNCLRFELKSRNLDTALRLSGVIVTKGAFSL
jgi:hypothetical protein